MNKIMKFAGLIAIGIAALALGACAPQQTGTLVSASDAQTAGIVNMGTITGSRAVTISGERTAGTAVGTIAGGVIGGLIGDEIGKGLGNDLATAAGVTLGAAAGSRIANEAAQTQSIEWFVKLDNGQTISVIQSDPVFSNGQRVQVIQNGSSTRIVPA
jgi:outer membrane lipoprotein SlyB